jgi:hypothetical protein
MNRYNIMLLASTFTCGLLYAGEAPKDVVEQEAAKMAATIQVLSSPTRLVTPQASPKRNSYSGLPTGCVVMERQESGSVHRYSASYSSSSSHPYWADFPGAGYNPKR